MTTSRTYVKSEVVGSSDKSVSDAIESAIDPHRRRKPARTPGEVDELARTAPLDHQWNSVDWLERAQQHACPDAGRLARYVAHIRGSVGEIDIGVAALEIESAIARGGAMKGVTARVTRRIGLGFNDPPTGSTVEVLTHQDLADEVARKRNRREWQLRAPQTPERLRGVDGYQVVRSPIHR